jgi:hypothetical protein
MARVRYDVIVQVSVRGNRQPNFVTNREPLRPGSLPDAIDEVVQQQYEHLGFGIRHYSKLPKYMVKGLRLNGVGVLDTDVVMMYCPQTKAAVVVKAVVHG